MAGGRARCLGQENEGKRVWRHRPIWEPTDQGGKMPSRARASRMGFRTGVPVLWSLAGSRCLLPRPLAALSQPRGLVGFPQDRCGGERVSESCLL